MKIKTIIDENGGFAAHQIIWAYDYGSKSRSKYSAKHDNILWYAKNKDSYVFDYKNIDRVPYMSNRCNSMMKQNRGKVITDVWWNTIVPTNGKEKTGYPTQKPLAILERIVKMHSKTNDICLGFFAGSGSFLEACFKHNRYSVGIDINPQAIKVMKKRLPTFLYSDLTGGINPNKSFNDLCEEQ